MDNISYHEVAYLCSHIYENSRPVLFVSKMDGDWQFLCGGKDHAGEIPHVVGIGHIIERDPSLIEILKLNEDWEAERKDLHSAWDYKECNSED